MALAPQAGYGRSAKFTFVVPESADGSGVTPIDLKRPYSFIVIRMDAVGDAASLSFNLEAGDTAADTMVEVYDGGVQYLTALPATGGYRSLVKELYGAQRVRIVLTSSLAGGESATFDVYGFDPVVT